MDSGLDHLVSLGLSEDDALEAAFGVATLLAEAGELPEFPEDPDDDTAAASWLVAAHDYSFFDFVASSLTE